ncbi:tail fiber domain-containing protein [Noviherbaspirillum pedocola]|uniref:Tail fiber domain-containing protein n=1 Tax=Noviherbaspirillum pedocola TaxID=2801341 RepID=A0A934T476_9BURK|nr:tail fiber domain-containing protein [Noviherbaspirillum pedocola]MBK4738908.1 tail fiber domain-containing protein [Noviherbaspirillum pedocola]
MHPEHRNMATSPAFSLTRRVVLAAFTIGATVLAPLASAASANEVLGVADMTRSATQKIAVQQAIIALASESSDSDADGFIEPPAMDTTAGGPAGGGFIPSTSAAPKTDSYGMKLGYCAWDNGSTNTSTGRISGSTSSPGAPVLAIISAGIDNTFNTTCASLAAGGGAAGDDFVIAYNSIQIQQGNSGTLFFGDPVASLSVLQGLSAATLKDGQLRLTKDTNALYRWNAGTSVWTPVGGTGSSMPWLTDNNNNYYSNNQISIGTKSPLAMFQVHAGALGTSAGNTLDISMASHTNGNYTMLRTLAYRFANGGGWDTASTRLQMKVDSTDMGYIEFNPAGAQGGIVFGTGMSTNGPGAIPERMRISQDGRVGVNLTTPYAGVAVNYSGLIGNANQYPYDVGAGTIAAGKSIYSYGTMCIGNSNADCSGTYGLYMYYGGININQNNQYPTNLSQGYNGALKVTTPSGWVDIGSENSGWAHFVTDRNLFYFNRELQAETALRVYNTNTYFTRTDGIINGYRVWTEQPWAGRTVASNSYGYDFWSAPLQIREYNYEVGNGGDINRAPRLAFHWGQVAAAMIRLNYDAVIELVNQSGTDYASMRGGNFWGYGFYQYSDARLKRDIAPISNALATIANLHGYRYYFDHENHPDRKLPTGRQIGFIAQEMEKWVPELVTTGGDGYKTVNYAQMTALLLEGINEQQAVLQHLTKKNQSTLSFAIPTIEGNDAHFKRIETEKLTAAQIEAEQARIKKLKAEEIEAERISLVKTGEAEVFVNAGSFQPIFAPATGTQYMVNAFAEDGSIAIASVTATGKRLIVTPISGSGIDVQAWGNQIGVLAENKTVKTTWIRTH